MRAEAVLSKDGLYRYKLTRVWDESIPTLIWIMLNPSTADATKDDPTIRKCMKFAKRWGLGGIDVFNLSPLRATDPKKLYLAEEPKDVTDWNHTVIVEELAKRRPSHRNPLCAWGKHGGACRDLAYRYVSALDDHVLPGLELRALRLTSNGQPYHPLYLPDDTIPFVWRGPQ